MGKEKMNLDRITTLLASGLKPAQVASIVGISPARISQLAKDNTEFQNLLAAKEAEAREKDIEEIALSGKYHAAEHALLDQVLAMAPVAELRDVTAALRVVAERQEKAHLRKNPIQQSQPVLQQIIQLNIPTHALPEVTVTKELEIIAIDNTSLAPLTSEGVTTLFANMKKDTQNVPVFLPATPEADATKFTAEEI
jgi:hypothetical protein